MIINRLCTAWIFFWATIIFLGTSAPMLAAEAVPMKQVVSVLSFNIWCYTGLEGPDCWPDRKERIRSVIEHADADFVGLQEVKPMQWDYLCGIFGEKYDGLFRSREINPEMGEGVPLLYRTDRWELDRNEQGIFWLSETPEVPGSKSWNTNCVRIATWGRFVERKTGNAIYIFNTHLDHMSSEARYQGAKLLRQRIEQRQNDDPVLLMGDFNAGESDAPIQCLLDKMTDAKKNKQLVDTFRQVHPDAKEVGTFHGFNCCPMPKKIDYIFSSLPCRVECAAILRTQEDGRYPSDHFPISAKICFPGP